jgi:hypothetical protein
LFQKQFITSHAPPKKKKNKGIKDMRKKKTKGKKTSLKKKQVVNYQLSAIPNSCKKECKGVVQDFSTNSNTNSSNVKKRVVV